LLKNDNGSIFGILGVYQDVTENKKANEAIRQNQAKSEFLDNMSHELRTPMHAILSFARFGIKNIDKEDKAKNLKYFTVINSSSERLLVLLNDLLDLSKLEAGRMELDIEKNNLHQVFESCLSEQETRLLERNITIKTTFDGNCLIRFDAVRIGQVITNLLSNAIKFSPEGKTISIAISSTSIANQPALCFKIEDEGVGIPKDELDTIFYKFTQSSKTKSNAGGTGLGLAICKDIIALHQGKIWAENGINGGAIFQFDIPSDNEPIKEH
jgi:signal transduction histidine kinase